MTLRNNPRLWEMARYGVVGVIGTASHFGVLVALVEWAGLDYLLATTLGFIAALAVSYGLNVKWTFRVSVSHRVAFVRYLLVSLFGLFLNNSVMFVSVELLKLHYVVGQVLVVFIIPPTNYFLNRYWSFAP